MNQFNTQIIKEKLNQTLLKHLLPWGSGGCEN